MRGKSIPPHRTCDGFFVMRILHDSEGEAAAADDSRRVCSVLPTIFGITPSFFTVMADHGNKFGEWIDTCPIPVHGNMAEIKLVLENPKSPRYREQAGENM